MKRNQDDERLGMFQTITRRDFLQGTALALAAPAAHGWARGQSPSIPPSGFQGQDNASTSRGHRVRDDVFRELPDHIVESGEAYELIVVGAGLAGLAAAHVYKKERGGNARILLLENNDDFGGHARRNTFKWNDTTLIVNGGTYDLEAPESDIAWDQFFAKTPLSEAERAELLTLYTTRKNYLADEADPVLCQNSALLK